MLFLKTMHHKKFFYLCLSLGMLMFFLLGCTKNPPEDTVGLDQEYLQPKLILTTADLKIDCEEPNYINLDTITEESLLITQPGCHILSGEMKGSVCINAEEQIVHLVFNGVTVDAIHGPALKIESAGKVIVTLMEETENSFLDSGTYPKGEEADACIYSQCDLTINGNGHMNVYGYHKDAIHTKDILKVLGGSIFVQAKRDGLRGNDGIVINCESIDIQSEENGICSTKTGKETKGNIEIYGSNCSIIGGKYAISCAADLYIAESDIYAIGIVDDFRVDGVSSIAEGSLQDDWISS